MHGRVMRIKTKSIDEKDYIEILRKELLPAMGCTEPIAVALCAAKAKEILCEPPTKIAVQVSGNVLKNAMSVVVPGTGGLKGLKAAAIAGIVAGDSSLGLQVISGISDKDIEEIKRILLSGIISVSIIEERDNPNLLDIRISLQSMNHRASVRIAGTHTHFVFIRKDAQILYEEELQKHIRAEEQDLLTVRGIFDFVKNVNIDDIRDMIETQISYNKAISDEGFRSNYGANIGKIILEHSYHSLKELAKAAAAAGSDARMSGCMMPVVINSGSGNQGIAVTLPILVYGETLNASRELIIRALALANLVAIHQKRGIGCLSAYCGAVTAGAAAGCGIAYLCTQDEKTVEHTLVNALAMASGMICDGAKPSCAAKIALAVDAGILGYEMYLQGQEFYGGEGIISKGVENTIKNVSRLGADGMRATDKKIIEIMAENT